MSKINNQKELPQTLYYVRVRTFNGIRYLGPYAKIGTAKGVATSRRNHYQHPEDVAIFKSSSLIQWEDTDKDCLSDLSSLAQHSSILPNKKFLPE